jgi:hypothetical protein
MNDDLDALLQDDLLPWHRLRRAAAAAGLIGGGLLGLSQLAAYVFGLWLSATAI